jgi:hypothetical protein
MVTLWLHANFEEGSIMSYMLQRPIAETPLENARTWQAPRDSAAGIWVNEDVCLEEEWEHLWTDLGGEG